MLACMSGYRDTQSPWVLLVLSLRFQHWIDSVGELCGVVGVPEKVDGVYVVDESLDVAGLGRVDDGVFGNFRGRFRG